MPILMLRDSGPRYARCYWRYAADAIRCARDMPRDVYGALYGARARQDEESHIVSGTKARRDMRAMLRDMLAKIYDATLLLLCR